MSALLHLSSGALATTAEPAPDDKLKLHVRDNRRCDSAILTLSQADARAIVDALTAYLPERAAEARS